jgi:hypothetical protein
MIAARGLCTEQRLDLGTRGEIDKPAFRLVVAFSAT